MSVNPSNPKAHHFIPRTYLNGFTDPDFEKIGKSSIWIYHAGKEPWKSHPSKTAFEQYFYAVQVEGERDFRVEETLAKLESHTAPVLKRIAAGNTGLSALEREEFAGFIGLMTMRTPSSLQKLDQIAIDATKHRMRIAAKTPGYLEDVLQKAEDKGGEPLVKKSEKIREYFLSKDAKMVQTSRAWTLKLMFQTMLSLMPVINQMKWNWLISEDEPFLTSDNPVAVYDSGSPFGAGFRSSPHAQFTFPIGKHVCLYCRWLGENDSVRIAPAKVRDVNRRTIGRCDRFLYASERNLKIQFLLEEHHARKRS